MRIKIFFSIFCLALLAPNALAQTAAFTVCTSDAQCSGERCISAVDKALEEQLNFVRNRCARTSGVNCTGAFEIQSAFEVSFNYPTPDLCRVSEGRCVMNQSRFNSVAVSNIRELIAESERYRNQKYCSGFGLAPAEPPQEEQGRQPARPPITPRLQINIPGVQFSPALEEDGRLTLPFIGEYIAGLYKYLIGIVGIVAGIMLTIGGVQYLTSGGSTERVGAAKDRIKNALIGLVIAFGSYVILFTINPELVRFSALKIKTVTSAALTFPELLTTTIDTTDTTDPAASPPPASTFTECPISLTEPFVARRNAQTDPRTAEFKQKIISAVSGATPRDRVVQIADAAQKCGVSLGSCGLTAGTIYELAGAPTRTAHGLSTAQLSYLNTLNTNARATGPCDSTCKRNLKSTVYNKFKQQIGGYPDSWVEDLQPGDHLVFFNANFDPSPRARANRGGHAVIFMGWTSGNRAKIVQGNWGAIVKGGTICIKSSCSSPSPLMAVYKPEPPRPRQR